MSRANSIEPGSTWEYRFGDGQCLRQIVTVLCVGAVMSVNDAPDVEMRPVAYHKSLWGLDVIAPDKPVGRGDAWAIGQGVLTRGLRAVVYDWRGLPFVRDKAAFLERYELVDPPLDMSMLAHDAGVLG